MSEKEIIDGCLANKASAQENRTVDLTGEAFFEIVKKPDKPFIIVTKSADIRVLGTSLNVNSLTQNTEVSVTTGTVSVQARNSDKCVTINAGYSANANSSDVLTYKTSDDNYNSWKTGVFSFKQASLKVVIKDLNEFYDDKITFSDNVRHDCGLTANFNNASLKEVIEVLKITCNLSVTKTKEGYIIN